MLAYLIVNAIGGCGHTQPARPAKPTIRELRHPRYSAQVQNLQTILSTSKFGLLWDGDAITSHFQKHEAEGTSVIQRKSILCS